MNDSLVFWDIGYSAKFGNPNFGFWKLSASWKWPTKKYCWYPIGILMVEKAYLRKECLKSDIKNEKVLASIRSVCANVCVHGHVLVCGKNSSSRWSITWAKGLGRGDDSTLGIERRPCFQRRSKSWRTFAELVKESLWRGENWNPGAFTYPVTATWRTGNSLVLKQGGEHGRESI